jgi:adenylylsulfate kinase
VDALLQFADSLQVPAPLIECVCEEEVVRKRLEKDLAQGTHPAGNRTYALYLALKANAEPIQVSHFVVDTGSLSLAQCVRRCLVYLGKEDSAKEPRWEG